jgi:hypothetical protein
MGAGNGSGCSQVHGPTTLLENENSPLSKFFKGVLLEQCRREVDHIGARVDLQQEMADQQG